MFPNNSEPRQLRTRNVTGAKRGLYISVLVIVVVGVGALIRSFAATPAATYSVANQGLQSTSASETKCEFTNIADSEVPAQKDKVLRASCQSATTGTITTKPVFMLVDGMDYKVCATARLTAGHADLWVHAGTEVDVKTVMNFGNKDAYHETCTPPFTVKSDVNAEAGIDINFSNSTAMSTFINLHDITISQVQKQN